MMPDCPYCPFTSAFIGDVEEHSIGEHKSKLFTCYDLKCNDFLCKTATELNIHDQLAHQNKRYICKFCPEIILYSIIAYKKHVKEHHRYNLGFLPEEKNTFYKNRLTSAQKLLELGFIGKQGTMIERSFVTNFDKENHRPLWTFEHLHPRAGIKNKGIGIQRYFFDDSAVENCHLSYKELPGFNLLAGHLAGAHNYWFDPEAYNETYFLSNITPMPADVNNGVWNGLERITRELALYWEHVSVFSGVVYNDSEEPRRLQNGKPLWIPQYLYKIIVLEDEGRESQVHVYCIPNKRTNGIPKINFTSTLEDIETMTGTRFLSSSYFPPSSYRCNMCHKLSESKEEHDTHVSKHSKQRNCNICHALFFTREDFDIHRSAACTKFPQKLASTSDPKDMFCVHDGYSFPKYITRKRKKNTATAEGSKSKTSKLD